MISELLQTTPPNTWLALSGVLAVYSGVVTLALACATFGKRWIPKTDDSILVDKRVHEIQKSERQAELAELIDLRDYKRDMEAKKPDHPYPVIDWDGAGILSIEWDGDEEAQTQLTRLDKDGKNADWWFVTTPEQHLALCEEFKIVREQRNNKRRLEVRT